MARRSLIALLVVVGFATANAPVFATGCNQFFVQGYRQQAYVPTYYYAAPVVQKYVAPLTYYKAGQAIEDDAQAELVARKVVAKLKAEGLAAGALQHRQAASGVFDKCMSCHTADNSLNLADGVVTADNIARWGEMAGKGENIPKPMAKLMATLPEEAKGPIMSELLTMWRSTIANTPADVPPPPNDGGLE